MVDSLNNSQINEKTKSQIISQTIVQKYGGVTLESPEKIKAAALRISEVKNSGHKIIAVVSAMGQTTNQLLDLSQQVSKTPLLRELDMLLSVGERISMSLLSIALNDLGHQAISLTGSQAGILTDETHLNASIKEVKAFRVTEALEQNKIVILAGFQGVSALTKEITTLGRGGTDTTAVAMAIYLKADRCEILKDVPSIFTADPKLVKNAKPIHHLNYAVLLEMTFWGAKVLNYKSVELASQNNVNLYVGPAQVDIESSHLPTGTTINNKTVYESTKPIAVNSHKQVFKISLFENSFEQFINNLRSQQIGIPQVLCKIIEDMTISYLITGPDEMMTLITNLNHLNKDVFFKIQNDDLCSISLTCTGNSLESISIQAKNILDENQIKIHFFYQTELSLVFFLSLADKNKALDILHTLI